MGFAEFDSVISTIHHFLYRLNRVSIDSPAPPLTPSLSRCTVPKLGPSRTDLQWLRLPAICPCSVLLRCAPLATACPATLVILCKSGTCEGPTRKNTRLSNAARRSHTRLHKSTRRRRLRTHSRRHDEVDEAEQAENTAADPYDLIGLFQLPAKGAAALIEELRGGFQNPATFQAAWNLKIVRLVCFIKKLTLPHTAGHEQFASVENRA
ncbi:hypothetical protein SRHO_G00079510 [Serrasalmus rhombeus]